MSVVKGIFVGLWRAVASPGLVVWLWLVNLVVALPAAGVISESLRSSIGASLVHQDMAAGFDMDWYGEFREGAYGLEATFTPTVVGVGAFYSNIEDWLFGGLFRQFPGVVALGAVYALLWVLFVGGILDRFTDSGGFFRLSRFFTVGGRFFFRFLRLAVFSGVLYFLVYRFAGWLFGRIDDWTRDVTVEGTVLATVLLGTAFVALLLSLVNVVFDYAKIATFVEERRSMLLAALRGLRFVLSHPARTLGLYFGLGSLGVVLLALYGYVAPGAAQSTVTGVVVAFLVGQAYLIAKLMLRLAFYGGELSIYQDAARAEERGEPSEAPEAPEVTESAE